MVHLIQVKGQQMPVAMRDGKCASEESIRALETELGCSISESFKAFVRVNDGAQPALNTFPVSSDNSSTLQRFIPSGEIARERRFIEGLAAHAFPIAYDICGNFVVIDEDHAGEVLFWDHETADFAVLAPDFDRFLEQLIPFDPDSVHLPPGQARILSIAPDFKERFAKYLKK